MGRVSFDIMHRIGGGKLTYPSRVKKLPKSDFSFVPESGLKSDIVPCPFRARGDIPTLDHSHDYVCLNFGSNLAAAMSVCNRGCGVVGCSFQFSRVSGLDFVAKKSSLTISNGRKARRGCTALFGSCLDYHTGEACVLQLATDQGRIVVTVRRACQKARRIVRKNLCESIRHIIRKNVLLDAIPYAEQEMSSGLQDSLCFAVGR